MTSLVIRTRIDNRLIKWPRDYLSPVTYVPVHAEGNAGHPDCKQGVIISFNDLGIKVLYCKGRTVQLTSPDSLVWG